MAQVQRRIVHKQFNSPIALYSDTNVKETLDRELKTLNNGAVGIDFDDPSTTRTGALAKSAVLAALEEEERERAARNPGLKRVAWPPPVEASFGEPVEQQQHQHQQQQQQQPQPQYQPISQQQSQPVFNQQVLPRNVFSTAPKSNFQSHPPKAQQQRPVSIHSFSSLQNPAPSKPLSPLPLLQTSSPQMHSPVFGSPRGWSHVNPPRSPGAAYQQPKNFYNSAPVAPPPFELTHSTSPSVGQQPQYQTNVAPHPTYAPQPVAQQPYQGTPLRKEAPISQRPAPVYQSQPVASSFQGGANRRGDSRWPPNEYKLQSELDNQARRQLALGPAFRPKRVNKVDYSQFFAQNALQNTYPGYRVPPGTLHVNE